MLQLWTEFNGLKYTNLETLKAILCPTCHLPHNQNSRSLD